MTRKPRTAKEMIAGMPFNEKGRARTIYRKGITDTAAELKELMYADPALSDSELIARIGVWIKKTEEENADKE